jgi:hypothetical protein
MYGCCQSQSAASVPSRNILRADAAGSLSELTLAIAPSTRFEMPGASGDVVTSTGTGTVVAIVFFIESETTTLLAAQTPNFKGCARRRPGIAQRDIL